MSDRFDEMAHQLLDLAHEQDNPMVWGYEWECDSSILAAALRKVAKEEREACAKICDDDRSSDGNNLAKAIRARGER